MATTTPGRNNLDTTTSGSAVIVKALQGTGIALSATGVDPGTGDVTIGIATTIPVGAVTTLYIGSKARFTALSNGLQLEIQNTGGTWIVQNQWTEA